MRSARVIALALIDCRAFDEGRSCRGACVRKRRVSSCKGNDFGNESLSRDEEGFTAKDSGFAVQEPERPDDGKHADIARGTAHKEVVI